MGALRRISGSTLVETMVASVIFLCVFVISLETVSRLTLSENDTVVLVEADHRIKENFRQYGDGRHEEGLYTREYDWGRVTVVIRPYVNYTDLQELVVTAHIESISKRLELRHIVERSE